MGYEIFYRHVCDICHERCESRDMPKDWRIIQVLLGNFGNDGSSYLYCCGQCSKALTIEAAFEFTQNMNVAPSEGVTYGHR